MLSLVPNAGSGPPVQRPRRGGVSEMSGAEVFGRLGFVAPKQQLQHTRYSIVGTAEIAVQQLKFSPPCFAVPFLLPMSVFFYQINKVALSLVSVAGHFFGKNEKYD